MAETWEYAFLHLLLIDALTSDEGGEQIDGQWVAITEHVSGPVVYGDNQSALEVMNLLGQDGWILSDGSSRRVENNVVPDMLLECLTAKFQNWGIIRRYDRLMMYRRIEWADDDMPARG